MISEKLVNRIFLVVFCIALGYVFVNWLPNAVANFVYGFTNKKELIHNVTFEFSR
jgi:hypothetical protein